MVAPVGTCGSCVDFSFFFLLSDMGSHLEGSEQREMIWSSL